MLYISYLITLYKEMKILSCLDIKHRSYIVKSDEVIIDGKTLINLNTLGVEQLSSPRLKAVKGYTIDYGLGDAVFINQHPTGISVTTKLSRRVRSDEVSIIEVKTDGSIGLYESDYLEKDVKVVVWYTKESRPYIFINSLDVMLFNPINNNYVVKVGINSVYHNGNNIKSNKVVAFEEGVWAHFKRGGLYGGHYTCLYRGNTVKVLRSSSNPNMFRCGDMMCVKVGVSGYQKICIFKPNGNLVKILNISSADGEGDGYFHSYTPTFDNKGMVSDKKLKVAFLSGSVIGIDSIDKENIIISELFTSEAQTYRNLGQ